MKKVSYMAMAVVVAMALVEVLACGNDGNQTADVASDVKDVAKPDLKPIPEDTSFEDVAEPPLGGGDKTLLTRRGAHFYLLYQDGGVPSGPGLYWRQFSDIVSHLGVYSALVTPIAQFSAPEPCEAGSHGWFASHVVRKYGCGSLHVAETTALASTTTVATRYRLVNSGDLTTVSLGGSASAAGLKGTISEDTGLPGFRMKLDGKYMNMWGEDQPTNWQLAVAAFPDPTSSGIDGEEGTWSFEFVLAPDQTMDILLTIAVEEGQAPALDRLDTEAFYQAVAALETELEAWYQEAPDAALLADPTYRNSWYLFWENTASPSGNWTTEAITPSKRHYFRGVWLWDSAFHALALAKGGETARALARSQVDLFVKQPLADGHLPREIWVNTKHDGTQPPRLLTWAALTLFDEANREVPVEERDYSVLTADYGAFKANHEWFLEQKDSDEDGLCEWEGTDSGWDTSPRWDYGPVEALDLACWMLLDARLLSEMATRLDKIGEAALWDQEADLWSEAVKTRFWNVDDGFFYDLLVDSDEHVKVVTPAAFLPLFLGVAQTDQADAVVTRLADAQAFATPYMLPTVAASSPSYKSDNYWRGPVWIVTNALAVWGLQKYGYNSEAAALRDSTLALVASRETSYEYYDSQTGAGLGARDFMWSAAFYIMLNGDSPVTW